MAPQSPITVIDGTETAPAARVQINGALEALVTISSGDTEPTTIFAGMMWHDTANDIIKLRNDADDAWINLWIVDEVNDEAVPALITVDNTDALTTNSATVPPSARAVRVYIADAVSDAGWQVDTAQSTVGASDFDFTGIPAGVNEIIMTLIGVAPSGSDDLLVQLGDGGGVKATGYTGSGQLNGARSLSATTGFIIPSGNSSRAFYCDMTMRKKAGGWQANLTGIDNVTDRGLMGGGFITLATAPTFVRLTTSGSDTLTTGSAVAAWRT